MSFSHDWSASRTHWPELFSGLMTSPGLRILEIGCYEGQATCWFLDHLPRSIVTVVDPFTAANGQHERFATNVAQYRDRVRIYIDPSWPALIELASEQARFDLVYIDGSHYPADVLFDAALAWRMLRSGGLMLFDDYDWPDAPGGQDVRTAVDAFVNTMGCYGKPVGADQYLVSK